MMPLGSPRAKATNFRVSGIEEVDMKGHKDPGSWSQTSRFKGQEGHKSPGRRSQISWFGKERSQISRLVLPIGTAISLRKRKMPYSGTFLEEVASPLLGGQGSKRGTMRVPCWATGRRMFLVRSRESVVAGYGPTLLELRASSLWLRRGIGSFLLGGSEARRLCGSLIGAGPVSVCGS